MPKQEVVAPELRTPPGVFSHATVVEATGRMVFVSGMTARRADGAIAGIGDVKAQTRQVCENLDAALRAAGGTLDVVCRVDVYVRNIEDLPAIHHVQRLYFRPPLPAPHKAKVRTRASP